VESSPLELDVPGKPAVTWRQVVPAPSVADSKPVGHDPRKDVMMSRDADDCDKLQKALSKSTTRSTHQPATGLATLDD
jgi:hypothetical protein